MAGRSGLEELELTGEEVERLRAALADEGFRRLLGEYAAELSDPAQRATYEAEVVALEAQRGVAARFLHPTPGWVLRTSQGGARRCYLNVCGCGLVGRPEARAEAGGSRWALPHCLAPGREELGRRPGRRRLVYDVLFHPDALRLAARSARFRRLVDETALEAVERHFAPGLDRANAVPLRGVPYKGLPQASLLRTPLPGGPPPAEEALPPCPTPYAYPPPPPAASPPPPAPVPAATTPRWTLRQRSYVDLQDYRCSRDSAPSPVPRELEVTVELPLLSAAAQARLEVRGRELRLDSRRPAAYRLRLPLPYPVDQDAGRAAFDKSTRRLVVTLPVVAPQPAGLEPEPPGSRADPSSPEPPEGSRAGPDDSLPQPPLAAHVGANHVELPVCGEESGPAAESAVACPAPLGISGDPEAGDGVASDAASFSIEASACDGSPDSGPTCAQNDKGLESDRVGSSVELPVCPALTVGPVGLGPDMELRQCPEAASAVPSSELGEAPVPSTHLSGISSDHSVTPECHDLPNPDQNMEPGPNTGGSGSCGNPVAPACSSATPSANLSVTAISTTNDPPGSPLLSRVGPEAAVSPASSPTPPLCPPFQCTQDEEALMLLLLVPGIVSQSLKGELGPHQYRVRFASKDLVSYTLYLQLPAENKWTSPETSISVSPENAVIHLTKAPGTTGLWTKLYFGLNEDALQEKLFVTEDNVAGFLGSLQRPSCPQQPEVEPQPSIEVLDVSESLSRIRLKAQNSPAAGSTQENPAPGEEASEPPFRAENRPLFPDSAVSDSLPAEETKELAGWEPGHCSEPDPADSGFSGPGESQITRFQSSELASTDPSITAREQTGPDGAEPAGESEEVRPASAERGRLAAPVLRETDMRDGSVQLISHHTTHCPITFQNPLLYELD